MDFKLCMSVRFDAETQADNVSITNVTERLDIKSMIERAEAGILDLNSYATSERSADLVGSRIEDPRNSEDVSNLLQSPDEMRLFGESKESAVQRFSDLAQFAKSQQVPKKEDNKKEEEHSPQSQQGEGDD